MARKHVCFVTAAESTVTAFLLHQSQALTNKYAVTVVTNTQNPSFLRERGLAVEVVPVAVERSIHLPRDLAALYALTRLFRLRRFEAVHSVTPKAGLLAMLSASIARVPVRIYTFTGQVWATKRGSARAALRAVDSITAAAATEVLADSASQRDFLAAEEVVTKGRVRVLGAGSISGVELDRFRPDEAARAELRAEFSIPADATVFLFVGRLNRDKGVLDLSRAFAMHAASHPSSVLLVVGADEEGMRAKMEAAMTCGRAVFVPFTPCPERFMAAADVLCLPSYREGFGSVVIEAAAVGLPAIASRIYGVTDAVVESVTGLLHDPGDPGGIALSMDRMVAEPGRQRIMGASARSRAVAEFSRERLTSELVALYGQLLGGVNPVGAWR